MSYVAVSLTTLRLFLIGDWLSWSPQKLSSFPNKGLWVFSGGGEMCGGEERGESVYPSYDLCCVPAQHNKCADVPNCRVSPFPSRLFFEMNCQRSPENNKEKKQQKPKRKMPLQQTLVAGVQRLCFRTCSSTSFTLSSLTPA